MRKLFGPNVHETVNRLFAPWNSAGWEIQYYSRRSGTWRGKCVSYFAFNLSRNQYRLFKDGLALDIGHLFKRPPTFRVLPRRQHVQDKNHANGPSRPDLDVH